MLGQRIGLLRRKQGMSQAQLAHRLGISPSAMGMYEQGRREPSGATLVALSRELGVTTDYLLTGEVSARTAAEDHARLLEHLVSAADRRLQDRPDRPFTRQELTILFAALLTDP